MEIAHLQLSSLTYGISTSINVSSPSTHPKGASEYLCLCICSGGVREQAHAKMADDSDHEDVDVFVSPRRFGGRTPGPKATVQKIFEEDKAERERENAAKQELGFEGVKYNYDSERGGKFSHTNYKKLSFCGTPKLFGSNRFPKQSMWTCSHVRFHFLLCLLDTGEFVHKTVGRNNALSKALVVANYILGVLGIYFVGVAIWAILQQRNAGVLSYTSRQGFVIRSPVVFGVCFLICAAGCILSGYFVGVRHVAPSIVEGLQRDGRRKAILWYQILSAGTVIIIALIFLAALPPLHSANSTGISTTDWQDMSVSHPARICSYEVANKCAGAKDRTCSGSTRASDKGCPGHYCTDTCKVTSSRPETNISLCTACLTSFASSSDLTKCKASESRAESSGTCIVRLRQDVQVFLTVVVASSGVGIGILLIAVLLGLLSPIINASV